jgi:L-alanine-DL-glutamate epimerase-like enolase superfamily enzyme
VRIVDVDAIPLAVPAVDTTSGDPTQEVMVVVVRTDEGLTGLGECNHSVAAAYQFVTSAGVSSIGRGVRATLHGRDPLDRANLIRELYEGNRFSARRGVGLAVIHAIDVCLWDIVAQARGEPLWRTLWGDTATRPQPYVTIYTGSGSYARSLRRLEKLLAASLPLGYHTVKVEPLSDCVPELRIADFVAAGRRLIGDRELFVDVGHRFASADQAINAIESMAGEQPVLLETPLWVDDLDEYGRLSARSPIAIAASELFESPWEFVGLMEVGGVQVVQPWPNRVGITGSIKVIEDARARGRRVILAGWNATAIGNAASLHVAAGLGDGAVLEHAPTSAYGFPLRAVAGPDQVLRDGRFDLPEAPGLGVELDREAIRHFRVHG